jgi:hypothetical protein
MRIGLKSGADTYISTNAAVLPADGQWHRVGFDLDAGSMSQVAGANPLATVLGAVQEARILSSNTAEINGEGVVGTLGTDNITATVPGDVDLDGHVDVVDLLWLVDAFGSVTGDSNFDARCDFNQDGAVDVVDLLTLVETFGT